MQISTSAGACNRAFIAHAPRLPRRAVAVAAIEEAVSETIAEGAPTLPTVELPALPSTEAAEELVSGALSKASNVTAELQDKASDLAGAAADVTSQAASRAAAAAEGLSSSVSGLAGSVTGAVGGITGSVTDAVGGITGSVTGAVGGLAGGVSGLAGSVTGAVGGVTGSVAGKVGSAAAGATSALSAATSQLQGGLSSVTAGLGDTTSAATNAIGQATSAVSSTVGQATEAVTGVTRAAADTVNSALGGAVSAAQGTLDAVSAQAASASAQAAAAVDAATAQALGALPEPARDALVAAGGAAAAAGAAAADHPKAAAVIATAVVVPAAVSWYKGRFGGYAGELTPEQVQVLLAEGDACLVDIRPEAQREQDGTPALKLGARFKVVAFPLEVEVPPRVAKLAGNVSELRLLTNAAFIAGLKPVKGPMTRLVIMDRDGGDGARAVARALTSLNQPLSYVMAGGYRGWRDAAGLPVQESAAYVADAGALIADEIEIVAEKVAELSRPQTAVPLAAAVVAGAVAVANYHRTLEYVGVLGVLLSATNKALSYSSPQEALEDVQAAAGKLSGLVGSAGKLLPKGSGGGAPRLPQVGLPRPVAAAGAGAGSAAAAKPGNEGGIKEGAISDVRAGDE